MFPFLILIVVFSLLIKEPLHPFKKCGYTVGDAAGYALAFMLLCTATAHFSVYRSDLIQMVPPFIPLPGLTVTITGILEVLGAMGLFFRKSRFVAGWTMAVLFVAELPAIVYAYQQGLTLGGNASAPLPLRALIQFVFVAFAVWTARSASERRTRRRPRHMEFEY